MARTPLLRSLIRLARQHAEAARLGRPVEELREAAAHQERAAAGLGRRAFLSSAAVGATAIAVGGPARAKAAVPAPRVAVVGAGIAGLSCALRLADSGVAATVYEASGRIGGRMFSNDSYWEPGQVTEWGGELVDSGHKMIRALARRFGLSLTDLKGASPNGTEDTYWFFNRYYRPADADRDFQAMRQALNSDLQAAGYPTTWDSSTPAGRALDAMSIYDWIEARVPGGHSSPFGQLLDVAYNIEYGAETSEQSSLGLIYLLGYQASPGNMAIFGASDERYHIEGGNQQLPQRIAASLPAPVQTGWRLAAVATESDGTVTLTFSTAAGTRTVRCDKAVLTLPFAVLRTLDLSRAGFDARKLQAIQEQGRGSNGKLQLQFATRLWNQAGAWPAPSNANTYADTGYQATWEPTRGQPGPTGVLNDYTGGAVTDAMRTTVPWATAANRDVQRDASRFLSQIEPVYPGLTRQWTGKATSSLPKLDPNLLCSYSYWRVGQYTSIAGYERVRQGNVLFAGEHCSIDFGGYMEGGATEGDRAGGEILSDLGIK